jgi:hypothetical protein
MNLQQLIEYMRIHLISLEQDAAFLQKQIDEFEGDFESHEWEELNLTDVNNTGQMQGVQHILSVALGEE